MIAKRLIFPISKKFPVFLRCPVSGVIRVEAKIQSKFDYQMTPVLAHLSRRLIGELIGYSWSVVRPSIVVVHNFKHLLRNRLPDQSQILCGSSFGRGTKFCSRHLGHMTKMVATPIYGKTPSKIFFSVTGRPISTKLGM